jgi:hypothetical protein
MNQFARDIGILQGQVPYEQVVATQFAGLWEAQHRRERIPC